MQGLHLSLSSFRSLAGQTAIASQQIARGGQRVTKKFAIRGFSASLILLWAAVPAAAQPDVPGNISGYWDRGATAGTPFLPLGNAPAPVLRLEGSTGEGGTQHGDYNAPILQPWAADVVRNRIEDDQAGLFQSEAKESCSPMGVPHILQLNGPLKVLLIEDMAILLYLRAMVPRYVFLNEAHPSNLPQSHYGHSVGHFEGDTLVVDTIGLTDSTPTDMFGTPHSEQIHVVERYRALADNETLRVEFTVEDPGAFTSPWSSFAEYYAPRQPYEEVVCMENNRLPDGSLVPGPRDNTPDF